jgi:hypothetical protein
MKKERKAWRELREGAYMLRTNLQADSAEQLWLKYMQLTEADLWVQAWRRKRAHGDVIVVRFADGTPVQTSN